jgi:hypothetical protein
MKKLTTLDTLQDGPFGGLYEILNVSDTGRVLTVRRLKLENRGGSWVATRDESKEISRAYYNAPKRSRRQSWTDWARTPDTYLLEWPKYLEHKRHDISEHRQGLFRSKLTVPDVPMIEAGGDWLPVTVER